MSFELLVIHGEPVVSTNRVVRISCAELTVDDLADLVRNKVPLPILWRLSSNQDLLGKHVERSPIGCRVPCDLEIDPQYLYAGQLLHSANIMKESLSTK